MSGDGADRRVADAGPDHAFAQKFRIYAGGRWPLCIVGERLFVFWSDMEVTTKTR